MTCLYPADIYTFIEHRSSIQGRTVTWIGDSNNMCHTWAQAANVFDFKLNVSSPPGYELKSRSRHCESFADPLRAAKGALLVTTDVWTSMGFESEDRRARKPLLNGRSARR